MEHVVISANSIHLMEMMTGHIPATDIAINTRNAKTQKMCAVGSIVKGHNVKLSRTFECRLE